MKTKCYCIFCSKHPLYKESEKIKAVTGWRIGDHEPKPDTGKDVDCLEPESIALDELNLFAEELEWPITAYADGGSETGVDGNDYVISGYCAGEDLKKSK